MKRARLVRSLAVVAWLGAGALTRAELPPPFTVEYDAQYSRATVAHATFSLSTDADSGLHELRTVTEPRGLAALIRYGDVIEVSHFRVDGRRFAPIDYRFTDGTRKGKRNSTIFFDWANASAQSSYKGTDANHTLIGNESDRMLLQLQVMADMQAGRLARSYRIIDRNEIKQYDFQTLGPEVLSTPAGQFQTVKLRRQRPGSSRATLIWAASEHHFVPVKMIQTIDERPNVVLTVTALDFADEAPAAGTGPASGAMPESDEPQNRPQPGPDTEPGGNTGPRSETGTDTGPGTG